MFDIGLYWDGGDEMTEKYKHGSWRPMDKKYANDRFMITHTGYLVDTQTDTVFLTIQAFLNFINQELIG